MCTRNLVKKFFTVGLVVLYTTSCSHLKKTERDPAQVNKMAQVISEMTFSYTEREALVLENAFSPIKGAEAPFGAASFEEAAFLEQAFQKISFNSPVAIRLFENKNSTGILKKDFLFNALALEVQQGKILKSGYIQKLFEVAREKNISPGLLNKFIAQKCLTKSDLPLKNDLLQKHRLFLDYLDENKNNNFIALLFGGQANQIPEFGAILPVRVIKGKNEIIQKLIIKPSEGLSLIANSQLQQQKITGNPADEITGNRLISAPKLQNSTAVINAFNLRESLKDKTVNYKNNINVGDLGIDLNVAAKSLAGTSIQNSNINQNQAYAELNMLIDKGFTATDPIYKTVLSLCSIGQSKYCSPPGQASRLVNANCPVIIESAINGKRDHSNPAVAALDQFLGSMTNYASKHLRTLPNTTRDLMKNTIAEKMGPDSDQLAEQMADIIGSSCLIGQQ